MSQDGAQEPQDGAQEAATCSQDGILARFWELLGSIFDDLGGFLAVRLNIKKPLKNVCFFQCFLKIWGPEWKTYRRKSDQDGQFESKLGCLGRSWLQVGLSWEMLGARWSAMERLGAPRGAARGSQTGRPHPHKVVIDPGLGSLVPIIHKLQLLRS